MGPIHHVGISDISTVLQINGSLTGPAADMDIRPSPWQLQKRNRNTNWASLSDWEGKRTDHWQSWHKSISDSWKPPFYCYPLFPQVPLFSVRRYRHAWNSHFAGCLYRSLGLGALEDILTMGEGLRQKPVGGFAVYWLQMWWELNWFTLWDQHDNLLALRLVGCSGKKQTALKGMKNCGSAQWKF